MSQLEDSTNFEETSGFEYTVQLENYAGPLDLLLYLVQKFEIDPMDISLREIIHQFLQFLEGSLAQKDLGEVSEILLLIATLLEWKSRFLLPREEVEVQQALSLEQNPLLQEIWEFRKIRKASDFLEMRQAREAQKFYSGFSLPDFDEEPLSLEHLLEGIDIFDIINAYEQFRKEIFSLPQTFQKEEIPIEEIFDSLQKLIQREKKVNIVEVFRERRCPNWIAGAFISLLELAKQGKISLWQESPFSPLWAVWQC